MSAKAEDRKKVSHRKKSNGKSLENKEDVEEIKSEVAAFAAQLGLAGKGEAGFDDSDFRPQKGREKLADGSKSKPQSKDKAHIRRSKDDDREGGAPTKITTARQGYSKNAQDRREVNEEVDERLKERTWNFGVGPRPGETALCKLCHDGGWPDRVRFNNTI